MAYTQSDLDMADRHVAQGERHIVEQRERIEKLADHGHPTEEAEHLLAMFEDLLRQHVAHREQIAKDVLGARRPG